MHEVWFNTNDVEENNSESIKSNAWLRVGLE